MRRLFLAGSAILFATAALAANLPLQSGPWDPTNALGFINSMIQSMNSSLGGVAFSLPAPVTTSGTSAFTFGSYTIPANSLATGKTFSVTVYGANSADANVKTLTFNFGASSCALVVTGSANNWQATFSVTETGSKTQTSECHGTTGTTVVASVQATNWVIDNTAAIAVTATGTAATAGTMTANEMVMQYVR